MNIITKIFSFTFLLYTLNSLCTHDLNAQLVPDFRVNDDTTNRSNYNGNIGLDSFGNFLIVWEDYRNNNGNIFCQKYNNSAIPIGNNFRVNINPDSSSLPSIGVRENGSFGICWLEINSAINFSSRIKFRLFNSNLEPLTDEILINEVNGNFHNIPHMGVDDMKGFIIVWENKNIFFQRLDSIGNKIGFNQKVNDDTVNINHENPAITVRQDGSFIITWNDTRPPSQPNCDDVYMQMFDRFGNKIGVNQRVNDDIASINFQGNPKISSDSLGNFVIAWNDDRLDITHSEIYCQRYDFSGNKIGVNTRVTQSSVQFGKGIAGICMRTDGSFVIGWGEFRPNIPQCYFQRYNSTGNMIGNNYLVSDESLSTGKYYSDLKVNNDKIISVWNDERNGPFDVYCNIRSFSNPDTTVNVEQISSLVPESFSLDQNYPNPFNSSTIIKFDIKSTNDYKLELFNFLGQSIKEIFNKSLIPGSYRINFESTDLSSGIYYYILSSPRERLVKSFVLLK